jgi:hypothetical protein
MKGKYSIITVILLLGVAFGISFDAYTSTFNEGSYLVKEEIKPIGLGNMPVPEDFRNYFVLQSIGGKTSILIGDFSGADKIIDLITDENLDGKFDKVLEVLPDTSKEARNRTKPRTQLFTSFNQTANDIITGKIFAENYSYKMYSIDTLKARITASRDISKWSYGYNAKMYDPDNPSTMRGEFFFSRKDGLYTLIFATYYYKLYKTKIVPPIAYSVYCKDTKDPMIKAVVDSLYELAAAQL